MPASRIFNDIETVGPDDPQVIAMLKEDLADAEPPATVARNSSAERILERAGRLDYYKGLTKDKGKWLEEHWGTTLLDARLQQRIADGGVDTLLARCIVLCVAVEDEAPIVLSTHDRSEHRLLSDFVQIYNDAGGRDSWLIGHNNRGFDIPVLTTRFRLFEIEPPRHWPRWINGRVRGNVYDTMQESASNKPFVRAQKAAIAHGLAGFKLTKWGDKVMDGSLVADAYAEGAWDVLREYCLSDVLATRVLAKRLSHGWKLLSSDFAPALTGDLSLRARLLKIAMETPDSATRLQLMGEALCDREIISPSEVAALCA